MTQEAGGGPEAKPKAIQLSSRENEDAERLLSFLEAAERDTIIEAAEHSCSAGAADGRALQDRALQFLALRRRRHRLFGRAMFGEPAWEILLLLYGLGSRLTVSRLAELACASKSTSIRWIDYLEGQRLVTREEHPTDRRAVYVDLTDKAREAIRVYLSGSAVTHG